MAVVLDQQDRVLMMWRHRFVIDRWVWELPGGYVDGSEDPVVTAAREVEEETGWRWTGGTPDHQPLRPVRSGRVLGCNRSGSRMSFTRAILISLCAGP